MYNNKYDDSLLLQRYFANDDDNQAYRNIDKSAKKISLRNSTKK